MLQMDQVLVHEHESALLLALMDACLEAIDQLLSLGGGENPFFCPLCGVPLLSKFCRRIGERGGQEFGAHPCHDLQVPLASQRSVSTAEQFALLPFVHLHTVVEGDTKRCFPHRRLPVATPPLAAPNAHVS